MKTIKHFLLAFTVCCLGVSSAFAQPANDLCSGAIGLTAGTIVAPGFITGTTNLATTTAATDSNTCWASGMSHTVWYSFTAAAGSYTITTDASDGSSPDTQLQLFRGSGCGALTKVACSEDNGACAGLAAEITATLTAATYYVMVDIYDTDTGDFQIAVIFNDDATTYAYDCYTNAIDLTTELANLGSATHGCTGNYNYHNIQAEVIDVDVLGGDPYNGCNNNPVLDTFFGVWFKFTYDSGNPAWLSVHPVATPGCDGGESEGIFYTMHLFDDLDNINSTCSSVVFDGHGWCSVGDGDYSPTGALGEKDKAGNNFYDHPRLNIGGAGLTHGNTYYVMVAQMTRYTVSVVARQDTIGFNPITQEPIIVTVFEEVTTIPSPDNGLFYLTYEDTLNTNDKCGGDTLTSSAVSFSNAGTTGNIQTSVYGGPAPIAGEPLGYNGNNAGRGYLEGCSTDSAVVVGGSIAWENHNSAIYTFTIDEPTGTDTVCVSIEELEGDIFDIIDILCPLLEIYTAGFPTIFDPRDGTTPLLSIGDTLAQIYGNDTIKILDPSVCQTIKDLIHSILGNLPPEIDTVCFPVNCTPRTEVYFTNTGGCCGEGAPKIAVLSEDCVNGPVVMWSDIDCATQCVTLSSGLSPLSPGDYYVVVEGDGVVMDYSLSVTHTYSYGLGGAPCDPTPAPSQDRTASGIAKNNQSVSNILLQPVPASNELTIKFNSTNTANNASISVMDMTGKQVMATQNVVASKGSNSYTLDVSSLSTGMYLLRLDNNGERVVTKFSIAK